MEINRRKFQGVLNILSFNRHFYALALIALILIIVCFNFMGWSTILLWVIISAFVYGLLMPLIISAYVYDFSKYYNFNWLRNFGFTDSNEQRILNINAGFDETSFLIKNNFPKSDLKVYDFYNSEKHTEPAIVRARKVSNIYPNTKQIDSGIIPLETNSVDLIFLLSALHEIRSESEKIQFLKECYRVCKPNASIIMVEHLRDFPNFIAFSIGFTHFFSKKTWHRVFTKAGFTHISEQKFTPFMSIFKIQY